MIFPGKGRDVAARPSPTRRHAERYVTSDSAYFSQDDPAISKYQNRWEEYERGSFLSFRSLLQ